MIRVETHEYTYEDVQHLIEEGDVLLYRGISCISRIIRRCGGGIHSHVGIASKNGHIIEILEFKEFSGGGGRAINLENQLTAKIDVFRACPFHEFYKVEYSEEGPRVSFERVKFDGKATTDLMRRMTGLGYNYGYIWKIARQKIPLLRIFQPIEIGDCENEDGTQVAEICSSAVAVVYQHTYADLVPHYPNLLVSPSDLARSPLLNYLFTISPKKRKD